MKERRKWFSRLHFVEESLSDIVPRRRSRGCSNQSRFGTAHKIEGIKIKDGGRNNVVLFIDNRFSDDEEMPETRFWTSVSDGEKGEITFHGGESPNVPLVVYEVIPVLFFRSMIRINWRVSRTLREYAGFVVSGFSINGTSFVETRISQLVDAKFLFIFGVREIIIGKYLIVLDAFTAAPVGKRAYSQDGAYNLWR